MYPWLLTVDAAVALETCTPKLTPVMVPPPLLLRYPPSTNSTPAPFGPEMLPWLVSVAASFVAATP